MISDSAKTTTEETCQQWSNEVISAARQPMARGCISYIVNREVVGDAPSDYLGTGIFDQARAITWVILNNLTLTKELDSGKRHGNNQSVVYCHPSDISPCLGSSGYISPNTEVERGINAAVEVYRYRSQNDPTDGSLQWRHVPNEGWSGFNINQIRRSVEQGVSEPVEIFYRRHIEAANRFKAENPGRIYFAPQVTSESEATQYPYLSQLGTLAVFNRDNPIMDQAGKLNGINIYVVLQWPQAGFLQEARDSCEAR